MARPRVSLPFGLGLDRDQPTLEALPGTARDLRNVHILDGRARLRSGAEQVSTLTDDVGNPITHVIEIASLLSEQVGIVVGFVESTRKLWIFRVTGNGTNPQRIAAWGTLDPEARPPQVMSAEAYGKVFLAHAEPRLVLRLPTVYYDTFVSGITTLSADLGDGAGVQPVRFRGVVNHLAYLFGWGFGTHTEDRPEFVRSSLPGQPTVFQPNDYAIAGARGVPVVACFTAGERLMVGKETWLYPFVGTSPDDFGIGDPVDSSFGPANDRLAITVAGRGYYWSGAGPRTTVGGESQSLALPLDLEGPQPADLAAMGELTEGFVIYDERNEEVVFHFGRRAYALHLRNPQQPRWSYRELGFDPYCGGTLYSGGVALGDAQYAPMGHPEIIATRSPSSGVLELDVRNVDAAGDELLEIHTRLAGGVWALSKTVALRGAEQTERVTGLSPGRNHDVAVRHRRLGLFAPDYSSADPALWPAVSRAAQLVTLSAPGAFAAAWSRTSDSAERITLSWTDTEPTLPKKVFREGIEIADLAAGGATTYVDAAFAPEADNDYEVRYYTPDTAKGSLLTRWGGPDYPVGVFHVDAEAPSWYEYTLEWTAPAAGIATWLEDDYGGSGFVHRRTTAADATRVTGTVPRNSTKLDSGGTIEWPFEARVRHQLTSFGVTDHSKWVQGLVVVRINDDETSQGSEPSGGGGGGGGGGFEPITVE